MAYTTLTTQVTGERAPVTWANQIKTNQEDHESRISQNESDISGLSAGTVVKNLTSADSPHTILDSDNFNLYICDTTGGSIIINFPTLSDNYNKKFEIMHAIQGSSNVITLTPEGADNFTADQLTTLELPKQGDRCTVYGSAASTAWEILEERISCQLRLDTYAGYGSTDNKIMKFTNSVEDFGNCFSHNHGSYGTAGLEVTILKSGKYTFSSAIRGSASGGYFGFSKNSSQLTTVIYSITLSDQLLFQSGSANLTNAFAWSGNLQKNDVIRVHSDGQIPGVIAMAFITATYLGN